MKEGMGQDFRNRLSDAARVCTCGAGGALFDPDCELHGGKEDE